MLKNKAVLSIIIIILVGAVAYNIHFFYKRIHPSPSQPSIQKPTHISHPAKKAPSTSTPQQEMPTTTSGEKDKTIKLGAETLRITAKRSLVPSGWGRNPFFSFEELKQIALLKHGAKESAEKRKKQEILVTLSGIIEVANEKMAIINDHVMVPGEEIGGIKLLKVMPAAVWVTVANLRRWIPLPQSRVTLVVQENAAKAAQKVTKEKEK